MYALDHPKALHAARLNRRRARQRGLSIIEVMVGLVISLLVGLAATGSAVMFTASQRQGIGAGGVLVNATTALNALRDDASSAGLGFFGDSQFLCQQLNLSVGNSVISDGAGFAPVMITAQTDGDRVDVLSASQVTSGANVLLRAPTTGAEAELRSLLPSAVGEAVLLAPNVPGAPCLVRTVTAVAASTIDEPQRLSFGNAGLHNQGLFANNPTFPDRGRVTQLGVLNWSRYRLQGTDLRLERPLGGNPVVLARNVLAFRAEYGLAADSAGSTALESWQDASGAFATLSPANLPRVRALRIGLVTRSPQREKPNAAGDCEATDTLPQLFGSAITPDVTDWQCYRYRTVVAVVPLRNLVMGMATP